ncbi:folylpolyglutamate synthase/dihydrofolate synthase family protein [Bacillus safensis]|uniref:bifunctional folylpolyglutamate synthase/dihydrofolate synthase n=1 Tax=Bacillus safensis TaxID=561879 RepID=UPI0022381E10|nr:folylpolyglutamate synthase/dihydrofolate synthase family protein [Bacillus safensis]MCW4643200.1 bifunctional folylpolyglutamate synthase/dihydrofolate synthase [Bacillus safensis]MCY7565987.1 bifunctional folylpolyglutamate synthase/dihydrofolate synthase [Bacillus safensis]MCY7626060.1 bifunctional folylpolyglutamate synthase/dihydrofolate synthase [Bacillus safensis]MCY7632923.1 bifunctional folylpolyglutamate synthase/dihydrofolate synthase [Bacillus safensis]MCY7649232.1 bifunctional 
MTLFTTYHEAIEWIHSRLAFGVKPGLERMKWLMNRLGNPEQSIKAIHVAGTNGKGSTIAFTRSVLQAAGYSVGTFTSPFILTFNERISVNGAPIEDEEWLSLVNEIKPLVDELDQTELGAATEFEIITACAFAYFDHVHQVDFVLLETGLGGRLDSTNIAVPILTAITSIGHDHMAILGDTLEQIAAEKAGIIKEGIPMITAVHQPEALAVIQNTAKEKNAECISLHDTCSFDERQPTETGERFTLRTSKRQYPQLETGLIGTHQTQNASLAVLLIEWLEQEGYISVTEEQIYKGIRQAVWAGRFEKVKDHPPVYLDGAHNEEGIDRLIETVQAHFSSKQLHICFSALKDKPYKQMIQKLEAVSSSIHFVSFDFPRAESAEKLYVCGQLDAKSYDDDPRTVLEFIQKKSDDPSAVILVTGSLYFISDIRNRMIG